LWFWLLQLTDAAIDALQEDWTIDALEVELARIGPAPQSAIALPLTSPQTDVVPDVAPEASSLSIPAHLPVNSMKAFFEAYASPAEGHSASARCVWYSEANFDSPIVLVSKHQDESIAKLWSSEPVAPLMPEGKPAPV
jgi:hypothetical protein